MKNSKMTLTVERTDDNQDWIIMIEDMRGKRRYNDNYYKTPDDAAKIIYKDFQGYPQVEAKIIPDLKKKKDE